MKTTAMGIVWAIALAAAALAAPAAAQTTPDDVRRELQEMRRDYDAELKRMRQDYEARIQQLESRVRAAEAAARGAPAPRQTGAPAVATAAPPSPPVQPGRAPPPQMVTPSATASTAPPPAAPADAKPASATGGLLSTPGRVPTQSVLAPPTRAAAGGTGNAFNPAIGVVLDGRFAAFERDPATYTIPGIQFPGAAGLGAPSFGIGESEVNFSANIDDKLYAELIVSLANDNSVSVEEAFFETLALPYGFVFKGGRFFSAIGYLNSVHRHAWDFADQALPYRAFLSDQYNDDGVQLRWLAPTPFLLEVGGELFRGFNYPFAGTHPTIGSGAAFVHVGDDISENMSYRLGVSYLRGSSGGRTTDFGVNAFSGTSSVAGLDAVFKWAPTGNASEEHVKLQAELLYREDSGSMNNLDFYSPAWGWYAQAVYRFLPSWEVGVRYDSVMIQNYGTAVASSAVLQGSGFPRDRQTAALTYYTSEFGRFRLQYDRDLSSGFIDNQFLLQYTLSMGAHGAHKY